jgi:exopolysaccharide biosynthesis polyprenyl glycosylphosphotransferase
MTGMRNVLIVGWNRGALDLYDKIKEYPALGYTIKGFISVSEQVDEAEYREVPLLGSLISMVSWVEFYRIEEILIAIEPEQQEKLPYIIDACKNTGVSYRIVPDVYDTIYGNTIQDVYRDLFSRGEYDLRRFIDFTGAFILMILFLPLFLLVALAIKLESRGSVLYSQIRVGKDEKPFRIFKFRSMVQDAEKKSGPVWAQKRDPRITKMGRIMRATRLDELPQLMNILKGDMSFIGPRPERPFFVDTFKQQIPLYTGRLSCKPGVTGWAQVRWRYDESLEDVKEKLKYDLYYVNNHSFWLDLKIFFLTISTVITVKGQ